jgi:hypothetical protein
MRLANRVDLLGEVPLNGPKRGRKPAAVPIDVDPVDVDPVDGIDGINVDPIDVDVDKSIRTIKNVIRCMYREEDTLVDDSSTSCSTRLRLMAQHVKMRQKLFKLTGHTYEADIIDADRRSHESLQTSHDAILRDMMKSKSEPAMPPSVELEQYLAMKIKIKERESGFMDNLLQSGNMSMMKLRAHYMTLLTGFRGYDEKDSSQTVEQKRVELTFMLSDTGLEITQIKNILMASMITLSISIPDCLDTDRFPDLFIFDIKTIAQLQNSFKLQVLVVTTALILQTIPELHDNVLLGIIDTITRRVMHSQLGLDDVHKLVAITEIAVHEDLLLHGLILEGTPLSPVLRNAIWDAFEGGLRDGSVPRLRAQQMMQLILNGTISYTDRFKTEESTVNEFHKREIPIDACCIATLLDMQGLKVRCILEFHAEMSVSRYHEMLRESALAVLYTFPHPFGVQ